MHDFFSLETYGSMEYQGRKVLFYVKSTFNIYREHVNDSTFFCKIFQVSVSTILFISSKSYQLYHCNMKNINILVNGNGCVSRKNLFTKQVDFNCYAQSISP